jgi:hemerythrin-like domain-containing protein
MQRHASLHPLSRDHHHGLVQARKLVRAGADLDSFATAAADFIAFWEHDLERHFRQEEEVLLPTVAKYLVADGDKVSTTRRQHEEIRRLIAALNTVRQTGCDPGLLAQLGAALREHIRFEENELFPLIERCVPEEVLWRLSEWLTSGGMGALPTPL